MKTCKFEERQRQHVIGQALTSWYGGADAIFGRKPGVAPYVPIDLGDEIGKATSANIENADSILAMIERFLPGFAERLKQGFGTSMELMQGQIPEDVQGAVLRNSAWKAGQGGYSGTPMEHALTGRDLGLTSLDLIRQGENSAQMWTKLAETSYDPWMIDTMEQASATAANNAGKQATDQFAFNVAAAPDPAVAGTFNTGMAIGSQLIGGTMGWLTGGASMAGGGGGGSKAPQSTNSWGSQGGAPVWQYNPSTQRYEQSWQQNATWGT